MVEPSDWGVWNRCNRRDLFLADHADDNVPIVNANVDIVEFTGEFDVEVNELPTLIRIDLAALSCKLVAQMLKKQPEILSLPSDGDLVGR